MSRIDLEAEFLCLVHDRKASQSSEDLDTRMATTTAGAKTEFYGKADALLDQFLDLKQEVTAWPRLQWLRPP